MKTGTQLIEDERRRQLEKLGLSAGHDDQHDAGELLRAATHYLLLAIRHYTTTNNLNGPRIETWLTRTIDAFVDHISPRHFEITDKGPIGCLTRAGALIAADIDRQLREWEIRYKDDLRARAAAGAWTTTRKKWGETAGAPREWIGDNGDRITG